MEYCIYFYLFLSSEIRPRQIIADGLDLSPFDPFGAGDQIRNKVYTDGTGPVAGIDLTDLVLYVPKPFQTQDIGG